MNLLRIKRKVHIKIFGIFLTFQKYFWVLILTFTLIFSILLKMQWMHIDVFMDADHGGIFQVFYPSDQGALREENSVRHIFCEGGNSFSFDIPHTRVFCLKNDFLRLDPTHLENRRVKIHSLIIQTLWRQYNISLDSLYEKAKFNGLLREGQYLKSLNIDPQIGICLKQFPNHVAISWIMLLPALLRGFIVGSILSVICGLILYRRVLVESVKFRTYINYGGDYLLLWGLFLILVSCGITFSNFGIMGGNQLTDMIGEKTIIGKYRLIRSDEYNAHGILPAIQQYNHSPKFPMRNTFVGLSGRNFLMLHDTSAPVTHISTLAKPAVWGFFIFDLRRSLSWLSLFPIFFGLFSFWFLLDTLFKEKHWIHFFAAVACVFTMNNTAWSFWSAYHVSGTMLCIAAIFRLLRVKHKWEIPLWGILIGWGGTVSALTLYYPRVWYGGLLAAAVLLGGMFEHKLWGALKSIRVWFGLVLGLLIAGSLMIAWYWGVTQDGTFDLMLNATYPGLRRDFGGSMPLWTLFIGWFSPFAFHTAFQGYANQCEIQEAMLLMLPLIVYSLSQWKHLSHKWLIAAITCFLLFLISFCYIHYPIWLIKILGLEHGNHPRSDYIISLGQIFLLTVLFHSEEESFFSWDKDNCIMGKLLYTALIIFSIVLPVLTLLRVPNELIQAFSGTSPTNFILFVFFMGGIYFLITFLLFHKFHWAVILFLSLEIFFGILVNPICIAPKQIHSVLLDTVKAECRSWQYNGRIMVCDSWECNLYAAAGGKVFNGFFQYEDPLIFNLLFKNLPDAAQYHRLNHMWAFITAEKDSLFRAHIQQCDVIQIFFNGIKYDFSKLPIDYVLEPDTQKSQWLMQNKSLQYLDRIRGHYRFKVLHGDETK